jgi:glycosyltransferase involved in cell wall biosynthesis
VEKVTLTVLIPTVGREKLALQTIQSILNSRPYAQVKLKIIVVGRFNENLLTSNLGRQNVIKFKQIDDKGLYDCLAQQLPLIKSGYVTWLGAGDLWHQSALRNIERIIQEYNPKWFTGRQTTFDKDGSVKDVLPSIYFISRLIKGGWYTGTLPFIQQESTIWKADLHKFVDWKFFATLKLSGDLYLWTVYSGESRLVSINTLIGGYRIHNDSLSQNNLGEYRKEASTFTQKKSYHWALVLIQKIQFLLWRRVDNYMNNIRL